MKMCSDCKESKSFEHFGKQTASKDGLQSYCKPCKSARFKLWRHKNREHDSTRQKKWKSDNRDRMTNWQRQYSKSRPDQTREIQRRKHYKRKALDRETLPKGAWNILVDMYGERCLRCLSTKRLTIDHVIPIALGGHSNLDNLQILCLSCNSSKGHRSCADYRTVSGGGSKPTPI